MSYKYNPKKTAMREADTQYGRVRGTAAGNPHFTIFKGIPYAAPPVGELRWRMPQPPTPWEGVRDCVEYGNAMYQFMGNGQPKHLKTSEDCLYLNVYTPAETPDEKLPVLMFVPGGAFMGGASNEAQYDGEGMCKHGVVMVSINYRTGPLGMLCNRDMLKENDKGVCGNLYYLDQIFALKWVRNNIANFGGDPDKITVMGHSSGSVGVTSLCVTPLTEGDIYGAVIQSGPVTVDFMDPDRGSHSSPFWMDKEEALRRGDMYMEALGCKSLDEMRKLSCEELSEAYKKMPGYLCFFRGVIDGYVYPEDPVVMYAEGKHHDIHYMVGLAGDEGTKFGPRTSVLTREKVADYATNFEDKAEDFVKFAEGLTDAEIAIGLNDNNAFRCRMFAESQLQNGMEPVYAYATIRRAPGDDSGAFHGIEHYYIFQTLDRDWRTYTGSDYDLSNKMAQYVANFVYSGNPNGPGLDEWTPITEEKKDTMMFDTSPWMGERKLEKINQYKLNYFLEKYKK